MPLRRRFVSFRVSASGDAQSRSPTPIRKRVTPLPNLTEAQVTANYAVANLRRRSRTGLHCGKTHGLDIRNQAFGDDGTKPTPGFQFPAVGGVLGTLRPGGESAVYLQGVHLDGIRFLFAGDNR